MFIPESDTSGSEPDEEVSSDDDDDALHLSSDTDDDAQVAITEEASDVDRQEEDSEQEENSEQEEQEEKEMPLFTFKICGDNIDKTVKRRYMCSDKGNLSLHAFHSYAVLDRIDLSDLPDSLPPTCQM